MQIIEAVGVDKHMAEAWQVGFADSLPDLKVP